VLLLLSQNVTDETIKSLSNGCRELESLCLSKCGRITDVSLVALSQGCLELKYKFLSVKFIIYRDSAGNSIFSLM